jgi:hypothetical protein
VISIGFAGDGDKRATLAWLQGLRSVLVQVARMDSSTVTLDEDAFPVNRTPTTQESLATLSWAPSQLGTSSPDEQPPGS